MKHLSLLLLITLISCGGDNFDKVEELGGFRILAIYSETPEVAPGTAVSLQLYVSDVKGGGRVINGTTQSCVDPGIAFGAEVNCKHDPNTINDTYSVDTTVADLSGNMFTGLATDTLNVTIPNTIFLGRSNREKNNGVGYIVIFKFKVDGKDISAFKRIMATNRGTLNKNPGHSVNPTDPTESEMFLNGAIISSSPDKNDKLKVTTNVPETYTYIDIEGSSDSRSEEYQVAWYSTDGNFNIPKSNLDDTVKYLDSSTSDPSLVIAIIRDERGGVDVVRKFFP